MNTIRICFGVATLTLFASWQIGAAAAVRVFPAPTGIAMSDDFTVQVDGKPSPVYRALIAPADEKRRWAAMDDAAHSSELFDVAGFSTFDIDGPVTVTVTCNAAVRSVKVLPSAAGIVPKFAGRTITIPLAGPANLTVEVNGDWCHSLHLFANPFETDLPRADDPQVIYFGPGVHEVTPAGTVAQSGQTIYLAGGAILRATGGGSPVVQLRGDHVTLRGRGIIDGTAAPTHSRSLFAATGSDIRVEGVIFHDSAGWTMPVRKCDRITIENVKLFSHRANADGIDICNSRDVTIDGCFVRTLDDCIVVKTDKQQGTARHIVVKRCVLWNQVAHALSIGAELREPVDDVVFSDCDVIHDIGREWTLRVYHCDSAPITNVRFENIRVEQSRRLISLWIGKAVWSKDTGRGTIDDVTFSHITAAGDPATVALHGYDADHVIDGVRFDHVLLNGRPFTARELTSNAFVKGIVIAP